MTRSPRFVLVLAARGNVLRAALVTREPKIAASAHQRFAVTADGAFDPLEAWYQLKQVIAACLDIGRTLPREMAGLAVVGDRRCVVAWTERSGEKIAYGRVFDAPPDEGTRAATGAELSARFEEGAGKVMTDSLEDWFLWNLTGTVPPADLSLTPERARAQWPFEAELAVLVSLREEDARDGEVERSGEAEDAAVTGAAQTAFQRARAL